VLLVVVVALEVDVELIQNARDVPRGREGRRERFERLADPDMVDLERLDAPAAVARALTAGKSAPSSQRMCARRP